MTADTPLKKPRSIALYLFIVSLVLIAGGLLALLFGRQVLLKKFQGLQRNKQFDEMFKIRRLEFPAVPPEQREAFDVRVMHDDSAKEWWYLNAHLMDQADHRFTLMMALLKDNKLYGILSDLENKTAVPISQVGAAVLHDPNLGLFSVGPASVRQSDPKFLCYKFNYSKPNLELDLELCANKPPLAIGGDGRIEMGAGGVSRYYSLTNLSVQGTGRLNDQATTFRGRGWIDRQWGNWDDRNFDRWEWFSIQLEKEVELMLFVFWKDGQIVNKIGDVHFANGSAKPHLAFNIKTAANWKSPKTGVTWDTNWNILIPEYNANFTISADFEDHEVDAVLWEGGVRVVGTWLGSPVRGRGFYEGRRKAW